MSRFRLRSCLGALALLAAATVAGAPSAEAAFVPGLGNVPDCVPGSTICGKRPQTSKAKQAMCISTCRRRAARVGPNDDRRVVYGVCYQRCIRN